MKPKTTIILLIILTVAAVVITGLVIFKDKIFFVYDKDGMIYSETTENGQTGDE